MKEGKKEESEQKVVMRDSGEVWKRAKQRDTMSAPRGPEHWYLQE